MAEYSLQQALPLYSDDVISKAGRCRAKTGMAEPSAGVQMATCSG
jgi:hypothetical protein